MFFPPKGLNQTPADVGISYEDVWLSVGDGDAPEKVHGWWIPAVADDAPVVIYLHGNGSNISDNMERGLRFQRLGAHVLMIDYRGYGQSVGPFPNEQRVYEDAEAAWTHLTQQRQISADDIVIYGQSIGGAIAINLASNHPDAAGLIIESTFSSMRDMVSNNFPGLPWVVPIDWLLTNRFESDKKVRSLPMPILIMHGTTDRVIPFSIGQKLYAALPDNHTALWIENAGHSDMPDVGGEEYENALETFLNQR
ncbi:MAG: alpha/beta hydrolase [Cyanobacteria bacterium J06632_3]